MMDRAQAHQEVFYNLMYDESWLKRTIKDYNGEDLKNADWWGVADYINVVGGKLLVFLWKVADHDADLLLDYHYFHNEDGWDLTRVIKG